MAHGLWRWQAGSAADDILAAASVFAEDRSVILAGSTRGKWRDMPACNADFAAAKISANGTLLWRFQEGTTGFDAFYGAAAAEDGSVVLAGSTWGNWSGTSAGESDFAAVKLAPDGSVLWRWQDGGASRDCLKACVAVPGEESFVLAGKTHVLRTDSVAADDSVNNTYYEGDTDYVAIKLDKDGNEVWRWQNGTSGDEQFSAASVAESDSVILAGVADGLSTEDTSSRSNSNYDFVAVKLDAAGNHLWTWQGGSDKMDTMLGATEVGVDGSVVLVGSTSGDWSTTHTNSTSQDFAAVKLDADGAELWRFQDGSEGADRLYGGALQEDGSALLIGCTSDEWAGSATDAGSISGGDDFASVLIAPNGTVTWRCQEGTGEEPDEWKAAVAGPNGTVVLAGRSHGEENGTYSSSSNGTSATHDFVAVMLEVSLATHDLPEHAGSSAAIPAGPKDRKVLLIIVCGIGAITAIPLMVAVCFVRRVFSQRFKDTPPITPQNDPADISSFSSPSCSPCRPGPFGQRRGHRERRGAANDSCESGDADNCRYCSDWDDHVCDVVPWAVTRTPCETPNMRGSIFGGGRYRGAGSGGVVLCNGSALVSVEAGLGTVTSSRGESHGGERFVRGANSNIDGDQSHQPQVDSQSGPSPSLPIGPARATVASTSVHRMSRRISRRVSPEIMMCSPSPPRVAGRGTQRDASSDL